MSSVGKVLLGLAFKGESVPEDFPGDLATSMGKLVQRDSLQVRKEQQEKSKYGSRKVSFSSGTESAPGTHPNQERTISWSSQKNSITLDDYVNDEEADEVDTDTDSVDSYSDNDTFEADSNFGKLPTSSSGSISQAAGRSSLEVTKKNSKLVDQSSVEDSRRKSSFAKGDARRKVSWNGAAQTRSPLDIKLPCVPDPDAPNLDGTIDDAARRSSLTLAKKRKSSVKARQVEMARKGSASVQSAGQFAGARIVEEGSIMARFPEESEDWNALSFVFEDGKDKFLLYDPKLGPRHPTLDQNLSAHHSVSSIAHVDDGAKTMNSFSIELNTSGGTEILVDLASHDPALISELRQRIAAVVMVKEQAPAKRGGMSALFNR
jgi:hypothetical protein